MASDLDKKMANLTKEEENELRMRFGLKVDDDHKLDNPADAHPEARATLARLEGITMRVLHITGGGQKRGGDSPS